MKNTIKLSVAFASTIAIAACGGGGDSDSPNDSTGSQTGSSIVNIQATGSGDVSTTEREVSSGQSFKFTVTPGTKMVTKSVASDSCELEVVGDDIYVKDVVSDCSIDVAFDECVDCYSADDVVLDYTPASPLMERNCVRGGLVATGSENVPWHNLCQAAELQKTMLEYNSLVLEQMQDSGAIIGVFGPDEGVCDLPYFSWLEGQPQCESAKGGLGGTPGNPVTGCSALTLSATHDVFKRGQADGENTCVHELAHTIMNVGISNELNNEIRARFDQVKSDNELWIRANGEDSFALTNADEFFAEIAQSYFNANVSVDSFNHVGVNGSEELLEYDPVSFELVDRIFMEPANLK